MRKLEVPLTVLLITRAVIASAAKSIFKTTKTILNAAEVFNIDNLFIVSHISSYKTEVCKINE